MRIFLVHSFFIVKDAENAPDTTMNEIAHATDCLFSVERGREGLYGVSAYWVHPEQIKKSAPSGEFSTKGIIYYRRAKKFHQIRDTTTGSWNYAN